MEKYIIEDWTGKVMFGKCFNTQDEAEDYMYNNLSDDDIEEVSIVCKKGEIKNGLFYID